MLFGCRLHKRSQHTVDFPTTSNFGNVSAQVAQDWVLWASSLLHYYFFAFCFLAAETCTADGVCNSLPETPLQYSPFLYLLRLSGECVISSVLSCHSKHLKWRTLKPSACHSSQTVLQLHVTAQFYLENNGKYILEAWGHANPKDMKRRDKERGRETEHARTGERPPALWPLFLYVFFLPLDLPHVNWASQECCLFYLRPSLRSSDLPLFYLWGLYPSLSFSQCHSGLLFPILTT